MSETEYAIEFAKSGRSKCKRCKEPISKGEMRVVVSVPADPNDDRTFTMSSNYKVGCFKIPRKFATGSRKMSVEDFVREQMVDKSEDGSIFPDKIEEVIRLIEKANAPGATKKKATKRKSTEDDEVDPNNLMARIKKRALAILNGDEEETQPKKKVKKEKGAKTDKDEEEEFEEMVENYLKLHKMKADSLKDYLRWNRQVLTGTKDFVLFKVLDGMSNGRLGHCPISGGRLKFEEGDYDRVHSMGRFDEDSQMRIPCDFKGERRDSKLRYQPFFLEEPTEEQKEEMDKLQEKAQGTDATVGSESSAGKELLETVQDCKWDLTSGPKGIKAAAQELVDLVQGKVDLPEGRDPLRVLGQMLMAHKDKGPQGVMEEIIAKYGFKENKEAQKVAKQAALEGACENPKNAPLLMAFQELAELYFKEGNRNAGASYKKVVGAIKGLQQAVTADNAMSLSKGKTKIPGIGKSSAEKMKEFMSTGTIEKLEEKRALHS